MTDETKLAKRDGDESSLSLNDLDKLKDLASSFGERVVVPFATAQIEVAREKTKAEIARTEAEKEIALASINAQIVGQQAHLAAVNQERGFQVMKGFALIFVATVIPLAVLCFAGVAYFWKGDKDTAFKIIEVAVAFGGGVGIGRASKSDKKKSGKGDDDADDD